MAPKDRWLYHVRIVLENRTWPYEANSLRSEGFVHASFRDAVVRTAELYFSPQANLEVLAIDPRKLDTRVELAKTPRGEMPHVFGPVPKESVVAIYPLADFRTLSLPDRVTPMTDRLAVVRAESKTAEPYDAFFALRDALIACADESENAKADHEVVTYLREAESCQWGIGTFATGVRPTRKVPSARAQGSRRMILTASQSADDLTWAYPDGCVMTSWKPLSWAGKWKRPSASAVARAA